MHVGKTLFAQLREFVPCSSFTRIVDRYGGDSGVRTLSCAEQIRATAFGQLTWRESLRDIEASLSANASKLYAMGFRSAVKRSALADANESRDWRIWSDLAALLIRRDERPVGHPAREIVAAYCGVPILDPEGVPRGTLCHYDPVPREPSTVDLELMREVVGEVVGGQRAALSKEQLASTEGRTVHLSTALFRAQITE